MAMEPVGVDDLGVVRGLAWALLEQSPNGYRQFRTATVGPGCGQVKYVEA